MRLAPRPWLSSATLHADDDLEGLSVKELRAAIGAHPVAQRALERCLERADLVSLLRAERTREASALALSAAADAVGRLVRGMAVPVACGCPAGLRIDVCVFTRDSGMLPRAVMWTGTRSEHVKVALRSGSSQHGRHLRASMDSN